MMKRQIVRAKSDASVAKKGRTGWAEERVSRMSTLPPGPLDANAAANWPWINACGITNSGDDSADKEMTLRLLTWCIRGLEVIDDFSGANFVREALRLGIGAFLLEMESDLDAGCINFLRSCDVGALQLGVLQRIARDIDESNSCVLADIFKRLPSWAQDYITASMPCKNLNKRQKEESMETLREWIQSRGNILFAADALAP
jgi:hypothetical protein